LFGRRHSTEYRDYDWLRIGAVTAVAVILGFSVWLFVVDDDGDGSGSTTTAPGVSVTATVDPFGPAFAGAGELRDAAARLDHPVYWAGRHEDGDLEFTLTSDGRSYVRYLVGGAEPGDDAANFLTVATYGVENAEAALEEVAQRPGRESFEPAGGGLAVVDAADPRRVYFTPAGADLQVEVFDPETGRARDLVASGKIEPLG
jgi:hypothetical protein